LPSFTLSLCPPLSHWHPPQTGHVLLSCPSFLKHILIIQGGFTLAFHTCVDCA
jgi:hypothetical protein